MTLFSWLMKGNENEKHIFINVQDTNNEKVGLLLNT